MQRWSARSLAPLVRELSRWSAAPVAVAQGGFLHRATVSALERHSTLRQADGYAPSFFAHLARAEPSFPDQIKHKRRVAHALALSFPRRRQGRRHRRLPREGSGKIASKHLRRRGMVPGILFGPGDHAGELLSFASADIERLVRKHGHAGVGSRVLSSTSKGAIDERR